MTLELKFHVINNPNWSNFIIIYDFHGLPLYRFDRFNAVHYMVALIGFMRYFICRVVLSKIEKVPRGIRGEKSSKDMASSRNSVSTIGALASPKMGDGTRCPEG